MPTRRVKVASQVGLHARPAARFVQAANAQPVSTQLRLDGKPPVDARSILAVLALNVQCGQEVEVSAEGEGAEAALDALEAVLRVDHDRGGAAVDHGDA